MHIGEAEVAALIAEGQALVVESEQIQHGGVEVVRVDRVFGDVEAEIVGLAVNGARFDAATGHPHGVGVFVVVATWRSLGAVAVDALE